MSKLYIFGIGGTGSRVLKSLTLLLASGLECKDTIVPIIIDRDLANADLTRTKEIIDNYIVLNKIAPKPNKNNKNKFFSTSMQLLNNDLYLQLKDNTQVFADYIHSSTMNDINKALVNILFSEETLQLDMTEGFQGNPNIGSVVLNQFDDNEMFKSFANDFQEGDKIFIISSIFGGTGASGFPLLLKNLKSTKSDMPNWGFVQKAPVGAITVLPYFNVSNQKKGSNEDSLIDSDTFIDKSKAALSYYISLDKQLDTLYYIADKERSTYEHNKGGGNQKNNAHFIELASALAILDFANNPIEKMVNNKITRTTYKEFGITPSKKIDAAGIETVNNCKEINFNDLADASKLLLRKPLIQFFLFRKYLKEVFDKEKKHQPYARKHFSKEFRDKDVILKMESIQDSFFLWLQEMSNQNRVFLPFKFEINNKEPFEFVTDISSSGRGTISYKNWAWMDNELNRTQAGIGSISKSLTVEAQFIELFYRVTEKFVNEIVNN
ncbi:MAG: hypothetical protein JXA54_15910 [Candidatus Heimdallarchaeota archaeon]|nr:hypothetical protein [Candidatus Heimdallarchaeota archaeon]